MKLRLPKSGTSFLGGHRGFTLMEVLVATAITGFAIGVCMAIFAQGHSQVFKGMQAETASQIAIQLLDSWKAKKRYPSSESGELERCPGWSYSLESAPVSTRIVLPDGETRIVETDKLTQIILKIVPPDKKRKFILTFWVPSKEVEGSEG